MKNWSIIDGNCYVHIHFIFQPVNAQFGVAGNRRQQQGGGTKFQDLQQRAQQQQEGPGAQLGAAGGVDQLH